MITALWRQAHLIPKHGQLLLARLSPRRGVYVFWGLQKPSPHLSKSYFVLLFQTPTKQEI